MTNQGSGGVEFSEYLEVASYSREKRLEGNGGSCKIVLVALSLEFASSIATGGGTFSPCPLIEATVYIRCCEAS